MPHFTRHRDRYCVSYITGPTHVWLGVKFGEPRAQPTFIRQPAVGECYHGQLDPTRIFDAVRTALGTVKESSGSELHVTEIAFVENDCPRYDLYGLCAKLIAQRMLSGEPFGDER